MSFIDKHLDENCGYAIDPELYEELYEAIYSLEVLPSMRAIMTAGPALERDNTAGYNCFAGTETFITDKGIKTFQETVNQTVKVLDKNGNFADAKVKSFGKQKLQVVTLRHSKKSNLITKILVTPNHRWYTNNRSAVTNLMVGDTIPAQVVPSINHSLNTEAWIRGFSFGDGTIDIRGRAKIRLCGNKASKFMSYFENYGNSSICYPPSYNGDPVVIYHKGYFENCKKLPHEYLDNLNLLQSWLEGYLAADGHDAKRQPGLSSQDKNAIDFVKMIAPSCGYIVTGENISDILKTNFGNRKNPLIRITLRKRGLFYVSKIEMTEQEKEVYCVVEPKTHSFTLSSGAITGNCAYLPIDDMKSFDEAMYILLCGTGVGFSVERQYISKLPEVPELLFDSETVVVVKDSKEGWAKAFRQVISLLYSGEIPKWDVTRVRPAGARLKTFGGRASGPGPLEDLFRFTIAKFRSAIGRRLNSLECHDILCKIGEIVVVGGVRRSAMISLSNLSDDRMRKAKMGSWWETEPQRALANNSVTYTEKPDVGAFMNEWLSLYQSKSGERGIFNRVAAQKQASRNGRRKSDIDFGVNPCGEIILRPYQFCNLTESVVRSTDTQESLERKVRLAAILGTFQSTLTYFPYLRKIWQKNTEEERLLGVSLTGQMDNRQLVEGKIDLVRLKEVVVEANKTMAGIIGIQPSTACCTVKPSGTVSQLVDSSSGIHARHSNFYIRSVRADNKDPMTQFMKDTGIPWEPEINKPDQTSVFYFPIKSPEGSIKRSDMSAIQQLEYWKKIQQEWCEHNPSVTVTVKEDEWPEVGGWVYKNFDILSGVSFLPHSDHTYRQAPYEECTKEKYEDIKAKMPKAINWDELSFYEKEDNTSGSQVLACTADSCEIVDIT